MNIECLVLSGGGHLGLIQLGALYHLEKEKIWDRSSIKSIYGTSVGTIIAVLIAVDLEWDMINDYMIKRPWDKIFEIKSNHIFQLFDNNGINRLELILSIRLTEIEHQESESKI